MQLILASLSPYRRALLERLGVPFQTEPPRFDEEAFHRSPERLALSPRQVAEHLAVSKTESLQAAFPDAVILGGDQLVACDGDVLGKPHTFDRAVEQLGRLAGRSHQLITAIAVCRRGEVHRHTDVTTLAMRPLSRAEIERYVAADQPYDCAGSYKIEARGIALFERIDSADHSAIVGLPLIALTTLLRGLGFSIP